MDVKKIKEEAKQKYGISEDSKWMKLEQGDNKVRIVQNYFVDYGNHYIKSEGKSYGCLGKEECPLCENDKPTVKFLTWVIDREDEEFKILEMGYTITKQLSEYANNDEYGIGDIGFPYDVNIKREGEELSTTYTVIPARNNTPLTDEEKKRKEELDDLTPIVERKKEDTRRDFGVKDGDDIPIIDEDDSTGHYDKADDIQADIDAGNIEF